MFDREIPEAGFEPWSEILELPHALIRGALSCEQLEIVAVELVNAGEKISPQHGRESVSRVVATDRFVRESHRCFLARCVFFRISFFDEGFVCFSWIPFFTGTRERLRLSLE
jgi:hypothetical protein